MNSNRKFVYSKGDRLNHDEQPFMMGHVMAPLRNLQPELESSEAQDIPLLLTSPYCARFCYTWLPFVLVGCRITPPSRQLFAAPSNHLFCSALQPLILPLPPTFSGNQTRPAAAAAPLTRMLALGILFITATAPPIPPPPPLHPPTTRITPPSRQLFAAPSNHLFCCRLVHRWKAEESIQQVYRCQKSLVHRCKAEELMHQVHQFRKILVHRWKTEELMHQIYQFWKCLGHRCKAKELIHKVYRYRKTLIILRPWLIH